MPVSTRTLVQIAAWGGVVVASTGFFLQNRLIENMRANSYYKDALKKLRSHPGAVYYLGEPIKDRKFKLSDTANNSYDTSKAKFCIPVVGQKERGKYYFWAERSEKGWDVVRAELELPSKPEESKHHKKLDISLIDLSMMAGFIGTSKEKFYYHNTLLCLVKSLHNKNITIDLRNDAYVCGCVASVDGYMNISFTNAVYCDTRANEYFFEYLFVHARNVRYVHIPETISVITAIKDEISSTKVRSSTKKPEVKSRKATKALQSHMQTVASLNKD